MIHWYYVLADFDIRLAYQDAVKLINATEVVNGLLDLDNSLRNDFQVAVILNIRRRLKTHQKISFIHTLREFLISRTRKRS